MAEVTKPIPVRIQVTDGVLIPDKNEKGLFSSWKIAFFGALVLLILLPLYFSAPVQNWVLRLLVKVSPFDLQTYLTLKDIASENYTNLWWTIYGWIPSGLSITFQVTLLSILFALILGLAAGLGQISRNTIVNRTATVYVEVVRGIPLLVQVFFIYFALGSLLRLQDMTAAVASMAFCYGAYLGEIFRAGIQAVPKGQMEAALALGLSRTQAIIHIIIPQTVKIVLPAIGNEFIALLKDSSIVSVLALTDLLRQAKNFGSTYGNYFPPLTIVALVYLVMTLFLSWVVGRMEERLNKNVR